MFPSEAVALHLQDTVFLDGSSCVISEQMLPGCSEQITVLLSLS